MNKFEFIGYSIVPEVPVMKSNIDCWTEYREWDGQCPDEEFFSKWFDEHIKPEITRNYLSGPDGVLSFKYMIFENSTEYKYLAEKLGCSSLYIAHELVEYLAWLGYRVEWDVTNYFDNAYAGFDTIALTLTV